jgi:hypothetical protein
MNKLAVYHHLGLGDMLICAGMIRHFYQTCDELTIFCKKHNLTSVKFMYRDLQNLKIISVSDDCEAVEFINSNIHETDNLKVIGFNKLNSNLNISFDQQFYEMANIPHDHKWSKFFIERDSQKEQIVYDSLVKDDDYIFIHEDVKRNFTINRSKINTNLNVVIPDTNITPNIFDYISVIENAKEVHCIDSSFISMVDLLNVNDHLFYHKYARTPNSTFFVPSLKLNWTVYA